MQARPAPDVSVVSSATYGLFMVDRHTQGRESIRKGLLAWLERWLRTMPREGFYRPDVTPAVAVVRTAQEQIAGQTWAYLDAMGNHAPGVPVLPEQPRGLEPRIVWERPLEQYRYARSVGKDEQEAMDAALQRAFAIADDDISLAMREASRQHAQTAPGVIGYRRVVHPEMSMSGACGLCLVASDRRYGASDLMPIHAHCRCTVAEITKDSDPGSSLNNLALEALYGDAGANTAQALKAVRYKVDEHGELGPVLVPKRSAGEGGTTSASRDVWSGYSHTPETLQREIDTLDARLEGFAAREAAGEDLTIPKRYVAKMRADFVKELAQKAKEAA